MGKKIGVLALQGAVVEHFMAIKACNAQPFLVKKPCDLEGLDGLVIPGGESTAIRNLIEKNQLLDSLKQFVSSGKPLFGTCAGLILLSNEVEGRSEPHIPAIQVKAVRNGFGRQKDSFEESLFIEGFSEPYVGVFIRAPYIKQVGPGVQVLAEVEGKIVAAQNSQVLVTAFHPELTNDLRFMEYFIQKFVNAAPVKLY